MAVVADRVIVELEAKLDRYEASVRRAEQKFDAATRNITDDARRMERDVGRNADAIGGKFRALAGTIAAAFSVRQIAMLADSYTRFTNQLSVAGLEGEKLARVQEQLFTIAQRNGVELEQLGNLYGRVSQTAGELGATSGDIIKLTSGVAAALRVQGSSAAQAGGAILGLTQALGSARVKAEEYNQIQEGALPILKAVAQNIDAAGGSTSRLRQLVVDGKVSNEEFFRAFLAGSEALQAQAEQATLTIANSFTVLNNALGKYIGEADASLSATEQISAAIIKLSENLDTVATALGVISALLLGRYVAGLTAAAGATTLTSTAIFAMQARAVGAATTMEALALTSATAGRAMLAAFGGPVGLAVVALTLGIGYLLTRTDEAAQASAQYVAEQERLKATQEDVSNATDTLAVATGNAREQALANAQAVRAETNEYLANARAALQAARAKSQQVAIESRERIQRSTRTVIGAGAGYDPTLGEIRRANARREQAAADERAAAQAVAGYEAEIKKLDAAIAAPTPAPRAAAAPAARTRTRTPRERAAPKGPDYEEIARRFQDDLERGELEIKQAQADALGTVAARREVERERLRIEQASNRRAIEADDDLNAAQREQLLAVNDRVAAARLEAIAAEERAENFEQLNAVLAADIENEQAILQSQAQLAETAGERRRIELRLLDLQYEEERLRLEAIANNERLNEAEREIARRRLETLDATYENDREGVERGTESPMEKWRRRVDRSDEEVQEMAEQWMVDELDSIQSRLKNAISKKLGVDDPILGGLIDLFIEQVIMKPLADAFANASTAQGGFVGALIQGVGALFGGGRASGGHVNAGRMYRINETGIEGFQPAGSGKIIPLGRMRGAGGGGVVVQQTVNVDASNSVNPEGYAEHIVARVRKETVAIVGEGMKRVTKGVPGRLSQFQRDGI